jgi:tRNA pseudouridine65 synthase
MLLRPVPVQNGRVLRIVYQDEHLVAIDKPAGLLVHRTGLDAHEREFALQLLRRQVKRRIYPVHRLDKGTSGVLLFALDREAATVLGGMLARQEVAKTYLAVVRGHPPETGEIDHPLRRRRDETEDGGRSGGGSTEPREAKTRYRRLATVELPHRVDRYPTSRYALVELHPLTGRSHQLRRHLAHIAHPIIGDSTFGSGRHNRLFQSLLGCHRLLLACVEVRLAHPATGVPLSLTAPVSGEFAEVLRRLGWASQVPPPWLSDDAGPGVLAPMP